MESVMNNTKSQTRQALLARLLSLTGEEIKKRSAYIKKLLANLPIYKEAKVVMAYFPLKGEVDLLGLIKDGRASKRFCFPVMNLKDNSLRVFEVDDLSGQFVSGPHGVMEPDVNVCKNVRLEEIDLILVPGIGFDKERNRLGRGAGFYDRFLKNNSLSAKKVGVAFDFQLINDLPCDPVFDVKLDMVVSENGIF
jgi:5-formyltetrahydrofolate cyclo-ligase